MFTGLRIGSLTESYDLKSQHHDDLLKYTPFIEPNNNSTQHTTADTIAHITEAGDLSCETYNANDSSESHNSNVSVVSHISTVEVKDVSQHNVETEPLNCQINNYADLLHSGDATVIHHPDIEDGGEDNGEAQRLHGEEMERRLMSGQASPQEQDLTLPDREGKSLLLRYLPVYILPCMMLSLSILLFGTFLQVLWAKSYRHLSCPNGAFSRRLHSIRRASTSVVCSTFYLLSYWSCANEAYFVSNVSLDFNFAALCTRS